jgi:hypothetical protein
LPIIGFVLLQDNKNKVNNKTGNNSLLILTQIYKKWWRPSSPTGPPLAQVFRQDDLMPLNSPTGANVPNKIIKPKSNLHGIT